MCLQVWTENIDLIVVGSRGRSGLKVVAWKRCFYNCNLCYMFCIGNKINLTSLFCLEEDNIITTIVDPLIEEAVIQSRKSRFDEFGLPKTI
jgi:hypothetical protein